MTAEEFEAEYAARSGITVEELRSAGRVVVPCDCDSDMCRGWASVRPCRCGRGELHVSGPRCDGVGFTDHVPDRITDRIEAEPWVSEGPTFSWSFRPPPIEPFQ